MGRIYLPILNPLNVVPVEPEDIPQYLHTHMDDYLLDNRAEPFQTSRYFQPWTRNDTVKLQFQNNAGAIGESIVNCKNISLLNFNMTQKQENKYQPGYFIYESSVALNVLEPGEYWFRFNVGGSIDLISEPIRIVDGEGTLLLEYSNRNYYGNIIFETGFNSSIRFYGKLRMLTPASNDTIYEDQELDAVMIKRRPYRLWELIVGTKGGVPDWFIEKMNWILGCSDVKIDGKYFTVEPESEFEETLESDFGLLKEYRITLRESISRNSKVIDTVVNPNQQLTVMYVTDAKGFGDLSQQDSSNLIQVFDFE